MSGIGRYLQNLMPRLIPLLKAERILILGNITDLGTETWTRDPRIKMLEFQTAIFSFAEQLVALRGVYHDSQLLWVPQYNIPLFYSGQLLVTIHDVCQLAHPELLANDLQRWYSRRLLSAVADRAEAILCVSAFTASEVQKYLGVDRLPITTTYPVIGQFLNGSDCVRPESHDHPYLLAVGNIKKHKNLTLLIAAFERVMTHFSHRLIIVGKQDGFRNSVDSLSSVSTLLDGRVRFTGHISEEELSGYYKHAHALIFPSIYEGFGFPLVEAMGRGCPIACSNVSSLPEVAGDAALLFDPFSLDDVARALITITENEILRAHLIERGLKRIEVLRNSGGVEKTSEVINRMLAEPSKVSRL
jgi:glycosyltransferase involved in cell wall biosynthesis